MDVREKLVELLTEYYGVDPMYLGAGTNALIEYLITKGVTVQETARRCVDGKPVTNSDRIRNMNDEELAMFLCNFRSCDADEYICEGCKAAKYCRAGHAGTIDWLQQPAEDIDDGT